MKHRLSILVFLTMSQFAISQNTILWKVTDTTNNRTSFIVGTYHQFGNSFVDSIPEIKQHLYNSELAIFESIDTVDEIVKTINNREESLKIKKKLKKQDYIRLLKLSENWKVDIHKLKPIELRWKLEQEFVKIKCKTVLKNDKWDHFDYYLQYLAKVENIKIIGLETNKEQLNFINKENNFPNWKDERKKISYLLDQFNRTDYNKNKCTLAANYRNYVLDYKLNEECIESVLIKNRNENWITILPKLLKENNCFVAVGLLHLYSKCGILEQLKNKGFKVEPVTLNPVTNKSNTQELERKFQFILDSTYQANKDAIGFMIHVESPDKNISWTSAVGFTNKDTTEKLNRNQPVLIASNTKTYVSASILKLIENGELELNQPIKKLINKRTKNSLKKSGYLVNKITVKHLLSHTSGITDYVDDAYFSFVNQNPNYKWTRDEQIKLAMKMANPVETGKTYAYGDINYLLLTEIIEQKTGKPFYTAIRDLLEFKKHNLNNTWFVDLEEMPTNTLPFANQYSTRFNTSSIDLNPSWDLYGGGGLASNAKDLALFFQLLFEGKIIKDKSILSLMYTYVIPKEESRNYCLGLFNIPSFFGENVYYHGGFWGTDVVYIPDINASISIFTLVKEKRNINIQINSEIIKILKQ